MSIEDGVIWQAHWVGFEQRRFLCTCLAPMFFFLLLYPLAKHTTTNCRYKQFVRLIAFEAQSLQPYSALPSEHSRSSKRSPPLDSHRRKSSELRRSSGDSMPNDRLVAASFAAGHSDGPMQMGLDDSHDPVADPYLDGFSPNYSRHPEYAGWAYAHIALMVLG
jgi:hypothetical protein